MRVEIRVRLPMLRALTVPSAASLLIALAMSLGGAHAGEPLSANSPSARSPITKAPALFAQRCARCHDDDGTGNTLRRNMPTLPDFADLRWQQERSDAQLVVSILEGKGTRMPAFGDRLSRVEARALVGTIRALAPQQMLVISDPTAVDFQERFRALQEDFERLRKQFHDIGSTKE